MPGKIWFLRYGDIDIFFKKCFFDFLFIYFYFFIYFVSGLLQMPDYNASNKPNLTWMILSQVIKIWAKMFFFWIFWWRYVVFVNSGSSAMDWRLPNLVPKSDPVVFRAIWLCSACCTQSFYLFIWSRIVWINCLSNFRHFNQMIVVLWPK